MDYISENKKLKCKCGCTWFTPVMEVVFELDAADHQIPSTAHSPYQCINFKCDKCGTIYNRYSEQVI